MEFLVFQSHLDTTIQSTILSKCINPGFPLPPLNSIQVSFNHFIWMKPQFYATPSSLKVLQSIRPALKCKAIISNCSCCINIHFIWLVCNDNMYYATSFHLYFYYFTNLNLSGSIGFKIDFVSK